MWELNSPKVGPKRESTTLDSWHDVVSSNHVELAFSVADPSGFHARLARQDLGDIGFLFFEGTALSAARTPPAIKRSSNGQTMLIWQLSGAARVRQEGSDKPLAAGDAVLLDMDKPYIFDCLSPFRQMVINLPTADLLTRLKLLGGRAEFRGKPVGFRGLVAPPLAFMRETARQLQVLGPDSLLPLRFPFMDAVAAVALIAGGGTEEDQPSILKLRVMEFLAHNYTRQKLTGEDVASELGVSRRSIFRAFDGDVLGLQGQLLRLRLDASRKLLESPTHAYPIDAVARLSGFSSPSNFTARFTEAFQLTPAAYRTRHVTGAPNLALSDS